jgi:hypothetical protein
MKFLLSATYGLNVPELKADDVLEGFLNAFMWIIGVLSFAMLVYAAILLITASGEPEKVKTGRRAIVWGLVGLAVALLAVVITNVVINIPQ